MAAKRRLKKRTTVPAPTRCAACGGEAALAAIESDPEWEAAGHPDHYSRVICRCCFPWLGSRDLSVVAVAKEVRRRLVAKHGEPTSVEERAEIDEKITRLVTVISPAGVVEGDPADDALLTWLRKLGIDSEWSRRCAS